MIVKRDMYYEPAKQNRMLHIWLPDDYYERDERYPVMYMFDGHNLFYDMDATYGKSWGFIKFLEGWEKKIILVGMECSHDGDARLTEYCPYVKWMFGKKIEGIGEMTCQWIIHRVKPFIDREYRTYSHREATAIGGSSMGGLMSIYAVIAHNDVFSKAACVSTGVSFSEKKIYEDFDRNEIDPDTKIYFSWGEFEVDRVEDGGDPAFDTREAKATWKLANNLQGRGADTYVFFQPGGTHSEAAWEKQIPYFMDFLWLDYRHEYNTIL